MTDNDSMEPRGFADIHIHLLPGVDDGPADFGESMAMLEEAWNAGTRHFCATPHVGARGEPWTIEQGNALLSELKRLAAERGMAPDILLGAEIALYADIYEDAAAGRVKTMGDGKYVLIESPDLNFPPGFAEFLFRFRATGLAPVIAHPERCAEIERDVSRLKPFTAAGALVQLTAASLLGEAGRKTAKTAREMLKRGFVNVISSDGHFGLGRTMDLGAAEKEAASVLRDPAAAHRMVVDTPLKILKPVRK